MSSSCYRMAVFVDNLSGGVGRVAGEFVAGLNRRGDHVDVFTFSDQIDGFPLLGVDSGIYVRPLRELRRFPSPFGRLNNLLRLVDLYRMGKASAKVGSGLNEGRYDVALVHLCRYNMAPMVLKYLSVPTVYYAHDVLGIDRSPAIKRPYVDRMSLLRKKGRLLDKLDPVKSICDRVFMRADRRNISKADLVLTNSSYLSEVIHRRYGIEAKVSYPGVDPDAFRPMDEPKRNMVLSVGHVLAHKGHDFVIKTLGAISKSVRPSLTVAGSVQSVNERRYLEELAGEEEVDVRFVSTTDNRELASLYSAAKVTALASVKESFGLAALESMACGTPVVAVKEGGFLETISDGETGFLVERDVRSFSESILLLMEDAHMHDSMAHRGREHVLESWTWDHAVEKLEAHFAEAMDGRSRKVEAHRP